MLDKDIERIIYRYGFNIPKGAIITGIQIECMLPEPEGLRAHITAPFDWSDKISPSDDIAIYEPKRE